MTDSSKRVLRFLPVLLPLAIILITGLQGINLGEHWDEPLNIDGASHAVRSGILLPLGYSYPTVPFFLILFSIIPSVLTALQNDSFILPDYMLTEPFLLQARTVFLIASSLAIVWVYLLVLEWRKDWKQALLAASILAFSWEFAYHIRWVTPDGLMAMFSALTILLIVTAYMRPAERWSWLRLAAVAAGLAAGSKYPAGMVVLPLLLALYFLEKDSGFRQFAMRAIALMFITGITFLLTTPGVYVQPIDFLITMRATMIMYGGRHEVHAVNGGFEHLSRIVQYFTLVGFSPFMPVALVFSLSMVAGIYAAFKENWKLALVIAIYPLFYLLYFSRQQTMIIRNYLFVLPYLAIFSAHGITYVLSLLRARWMKYAFSTVIAALLLVNAIWLGYAAQTIADRGTDRFTREFAAYIAAHPDTTFYLTDAAIDGIPTDLDNVVTSPDEAELVAFYAFDDAVHCIPANRPELIVRWFGPLELHYDYYTTWRGEDRIILMRADAARPYIECIIN